MATDDAAAEPSILRSWDATAGPEGAERYAAHFTATVLPHLRALPGFRVAYLLSRADADRVRIRVLTGWESLDAIRTFAGPDLTTANVEPEAQAVLLDYDSAVTHYRIVTVSMR